jgi:DNA-binding transcriptional MerR regulator
MTLDTLADYAGVHPEYVLRLVQFGLIEPIRETEAEMFFRAAAVLQVRRIARMRRDLGVNLAGVAVILRLTDELRELRKELEELRSRQ